MDGDINWEKGCTTQLVPVGPPTAEWLPEQLTAYARAQKEIIDQAEQLLAVNYWRLGSALNFLRQNYQRHQWERFLAAIGVDTTRASRARAIARTFPSETEVAGLTVRQAYERRQRKLSRTQTSAAAPTVKPGSLAKFFDHVCRTAELFVDEAAFVAKSDAPTLIIAAERAIAAVERLRGLLAEQAQNS